MHPGLFMATVLMVLAPGTATVAGPQKGKLELRSGLIDAGQLLAESNKVVYGLALTATVDKKGEGSGILQLDLNAPTYDEFGFATVAHALPPVKLKCTLKFVKKKRIEFHEPRLREEDWLLFKVEGPKLTSRLSLALLADRSVGHLLVHGKGGKVTHAIFVSTPGPPGPPEKCHPGCFPAATLINIPDGTKPIERVRAGDLITTVGPDGAGGQARVASVFVTTNRLLQVRTDGGDLLTTLTQPLCLVSGELRAAGELKAGDRIWRWEGGKRRAVTVRSVQLTVREAQVFNLILADPALFIANGFLARSKPPAPAIAARPALAVPELVPARRKE
jgi:hypothetical protein